MRHLRLPDDLVQALGARLDGGDIPFCRMPPGRQNGGPTLSHLRTLVVVLGDQLDLEAAAFDGFDPAQDAVWMAEVAEESTHVWSGKQRIALFLSAMRHFADDLRRDGIPLDYTRLGERGGAGSLAAA